MDIQSCMITFVPCFLELCRGVHTAGMTNPEDQGRPWGKKCYNPATRESESTDLVVELNKCPRPLEHVRSSGSDLAQLRKAIKITKI